MAAYKLTKKQIQDEIKKCGKDPVYFIKNYCKISHPERGLIPFKTYDFQDDLLKDFGDYRFNVILKARQLGISTIVAGYIAWLLMFRREKKVMVVATKFKVAANLVKKVKKMISHLPDWLCMAKISVNNEASFKLSNGSEIGASSTSSDAGRSEALSLLVLDEAAFIDGLDEMWAAAFPTLSTGGRCIALSTPNGVGNWFHETYTQAETGQNDFHPVILPWTVHPDRDQDWFDSVTKNMSMRDVAQEHLCNFNMSGETVINPEDIQRMRDSFREPVYRTGFDRNYWIWENYQPNNTYLLAADVARGDGQDHSAFHIIKLETMEIVAEYQGKVNTDMYANLIYGAGKEYGNCLLVVENNNLGLNILEKLIELQYPNLYYSVKSTHEYIDPVSAEYKSGTIPGFTTSLKTRPLIIAKLEEFVRNNLITVYSKRTIEEMATFVWNNGRPEPMRGKNDDLVMSLAIGCWVRDTAIISSQRDAEYNKVMLDSMIITNTKMNTTIKGQAGYRRVEDFTQDNKEEMARKEQYKYSWLYKG